MDMRVSEERESPWRIFMMQSPLKLRAKSSVFLEFLMVPLSLSLSVLSSYVVLLSRLFKSICTPLIRDVVLVILLAILVKL